MSSFVLRAMALVMMMIDHCGLALFPNIGAFRCIGRPAIVLYCFLIAQGAEHTRDLRAYVRRLLLLAIVSEIPFDFLIFGRLASGVEQNVVFSLLLGLLAILAVRILKRQPLAAAASVLLLGMAAMMARVSFGWLCVSLCVCFDLLRGKKLAMFAVASCNLLIYTLSLHASGVAQSWVLVSLCALIGPVLLLLYGGRRGLRSKVLTFLFYAAYPLHLIALCIVRAMRIVPPYFL